MGAYREIDDLISNGYEIRIGDYFSRGWEIFSGYIGEFIGYFLIYGIIIFALNFVPIIGGIAGIVIAGPLLAGFFIVAFKRMQNQAAEFGDFFLGFNRFLPFFLVNLVTGLFVGLGFILLIIPGIYLAVSYTFALPLIVDRDLDFWQAMEASRKVVTRDWFNVFVLVLLLFLLNLAGAIVLLIGLIFTVPFTYCITAAAYEDIFGLEGPAAAVEAGGGTKEN